MIKPEWGLKRLCRGCGARYYDMRKEHAVCPKCATVWEEPKVKSRRAVAEDKPVKETKAKLVESESKVRSDDDDDFDVDIDDDEDTESGFIEDASDLGEDDDDMAEVIDHMDGPDKD